jgi:hypothetical protein
MNDVESTLGARGFGYWRLMGGDALFCGKLASEMDRDELLCRCRLAHVGVLRVEARVSGSQQTSATRGSYVPAGTVTELLKDKPPQKTLWLACGTPPIIDPRKVR